MSPTVARAAGIRVAAVAGDPALDKLTSETDWQRAEAWLGGLLELPPEWMETLIRSALEVLGSRDAAAKERFRADVSSAAARFHVPQLLRLEETFRRIAAELEEPWD